MAENPDQHPKDRQSRTALLVVDVQPTFCEGGALAVDGGNEVAAGVAGLLAGDHGYDLVVTTQDWHIDPGDHFSDEPDFVETLNDVLGTAGVHEVDVVGIAFDHCVRATAMDAAANGYTTTVIEGLSASVAPETEAAARSQLADAGIDVIDSR